MRNALHFLGYQLVWWCCLGGLYWQMPLLIYVPLLLFLGVHFVWFSSHKKQDLMAMIGISTVGVLVDSTLFYTGQLQITGAPHFPFWMILLWGCFSVTFPYALLTLRRYVIGAAAIAAIGFPLTYSLPVRFGVFEISSVGFWVIGGVWMILFPLALMALRPLKKHP